MHYGLLIILIFTSFLLLRLFSLEKKSKVFVVFPDKKDEGLDKISEVSCNLDFISDDKWSDVYKSLVAMDRNFNWCKFAEIFSAFHDKTLVSFAEGHKKDLMKYVSGDLLQDFFTKIDNNKEKDLVQNTEIISSKINKIENITLKGKSKAIFDIHVSDKIISFLSDKDGNIAEGSKNIISYDWIWTIVGDVINGSFSWNIAKINKSL